MKKSFEVIYPVFIRNDRKRIFQKNCKNVIKIDLQVKSLISSLKFYCNLFDLRYFTA